VLERVVAILIGKVCVERGSIMQLSFTLHVWLDLVFVARCNRLPRVFAGDFETVETMPYDM
jgi:hypothetical protein